MKTTDFRISENFLLSEFTCQNGSDFILTDIKAAICLTNLVNHILQPLRNAMGFGIEIHSGYRTIKHNSDVGGQDNSQHLFGEACDLDCKDIMKAFNWIANNCIFDQLILELSKKTGLKVIHVSFVTDRVNRQQIVNKWLIN